MLKKLQNKKGITLMEMLIVVAINAVLVANANPSLLLPSPPSTAP